MGEAFIRCMNLMEIFKIMPVVYSSYHTAEPCLYWKP